MSVRIRIDHGQDAGRVWRLGRPGVYLIGRHPQATLRVLDMKVSKEHGAIVVRNGAGGSSVVLQDYDSTHGTLVNGQPVSKEVPLRAGDEIR